MAQTRRGLLRGVAAVAATAAATPAVAAPTSSPDAELIRLCAAETENSQRFLALSEETADLVGPQPLEVAREYRLLVNRTNEARDVISAMPAATLAGVRAKAEAYRADWFDPVYGDDEDAIAQSLIDDLLRLLPAGGAA